MWLDNAPMENFPLDKFDARELRVKPGTHIKFEDGTAALTSKGWCWVAKEDYVNGGFAWAKVSGSVGPHSIQLLANHVMSTTTIYPVPDKGRIG